MSYVDRHLNRGETVIHRTTLHPIIFYPIPLVSLPLALAFLVNLNLGPLFAICVVALLAHLVLWLRYISSEFAVTSGRVIIKVGWLSTYTSELQLGKVEALSVNQGILGRLLDYGTLVVGGTKEAFTFIKAPIAFQRKGGTVALKPLTDAIAMVQAGTDRTAAELALYRLPQELNALVWQRNQKVDNWQRELAGPRGTASTYVLFGILLCTALVLVVTTVLIIKAGVVAAVIGWVLCILISVAVISWIRRLVSTTRDEDIKSIEEARLRDLAAIDKQINTLSEKIERNRTIANS